MGPPRWWPSVVHDELVDLPASFPNCPDNPDEARAEQEQRSGFGDDCRSNVGDDEMPCLVRIHGDNVKRAQL